MLRSRTGVAGKSVVWTGVSSAGRSSYLSATELPDPFPGLPAPVDPLLEVRGLVTDGRLITVAGQHHRVRRKLGEDPLLERADDRREVSSLELRVAGASREQRVAA